MVAFCRLLALATGILLWHDSVFAQQSETNRPTRFQKAIDTFKKQDKEHFPGTGKILFIGSSSFTRWKDAQSYFPDHPLINRAFGGSRLTDLIYYVDDIVAPYQARQVVIYCGNDLAETGVTPQQVAGRFATLFSAIRKTDQHVPIAFISIRPEPADEHNPDKVKRKTAANALIKAFLGKQENAAYINVYDAMFNTDGSLKQDLFVSDGHMNKNGYAIWRKIMEPCLLK